MTDTILVEALKKLRDYNVDIREGRINYRPEDHIDVIDAALSARASAGEGGEVDRYRIKLVRDDAAFGYTLERDPDGPLCRYSQVAQTLLAVALTTRPTPEAQEAMASEFPEPSAEALAKARNEALTRTSFDSKMAKAAWIIDRARAIDAALALPAQGEGK